MTAILGLHVVPGVIALSGMPIYAEVYLLDKDTRKALPNKLISYHLDIAGITAYTGIAVTDVNGNAWIQMGDVLADFVKAPDFGNTNDLIVHRSDLIQEICITVSSDGAETRTETRKVIYGRINKRMYQHLLYQNSNIFTYKFLNPKANFLSGTLSAVYASELMPLMGIGTGDVLHVSGNGAKMEFQTEYLIPYEVNMPGLVERFGNDITFKLGSDEWTSGMIYSITDDPTEDITVFEFRNTFGVKERFATTGKKQRSHKVTKENDLQRYDRDLDQFIPTSAYPEWNMEQTVATGYMDATRAQSAMALLMSEEVYLIRDNIPERVQVKCGNKIPDEIITPLNLSLTVEMVGGDTGFIPDLNGDAYGNPQIHNGNYNKQYN